jgi:hypothetical protein
VITTVLPQWVDMDALSSFNHRFLIVLSTARHRDSKRSSWYYQQAHSVLYIVV